MFENATLSDSVIVEVSKRIGLQGSGPQDLSRKIAQQDAMLYKITHSYINSYIRWESVTRDIEQSPSDKEKFRPLLLGAIDEKLAWRKSLQLYLNTYYKPNSNENKALPSQKRNISLSTKAQISLDSYLDLPRMTIDRLLTELEFGDLRYDEAMVDSEDSGASVRVKRERVGEFRIGIVYRVEGSDLEVLDIMATRQGAGGIE